MKRGGPLKRTPLKRGAGPKRRKPIAKQSTAQARRTRLYLIERRKYLESHRVCEHQFPGCNLEAVQIDHRIRRSHSREKVTDPANFIATCVPCHDYRDAQLTKDQRRELKLGIYAEAAE